RKGIDILTEAARKLPGVTFYVIGVGPEMVAHLQPPLNMKFCPPILRKDVLPYYQRAKVYCQPSRREGLPNALCEAMLCGCIPVASEVSGNPTAVGTEGLLVPAGDALALVTALRQALTMEDALGMKARARIVSMFPKQRRENGLVRVIEGLQ
ncbi:MAG: glycosyltransferase family 4 protein, partial [Ignavibacteriales bacterium]|nr:glycosyltransferase family 4 protein [Ignavibacteriales bacterium]